MHIELSVLVVKRAAVIYITTQSLVVSGLRIKDTMLPSSWHAVDSYTAAAAAANNLM